MPTPGPLELVIILVIALIILGPGKLPDVGASLGKSIREFRKATREDEPASTPGSALPSASSSPAVSASASSAAGVRYCIECGAKASEGQRFCMSCGKPLAA